MLLSWSEMSRSSKLFCLSEKTAVVLQYVFKHIELMKNYLIRLTMAVMTAAVVSGVSSCDKNALDAPQKAKYLTICDEQSAMENFSISLSKAVFSYPEVREFLKAEALKRFDNDDEVFYPFVKDQEVGSLGTFREILVDELGSEEMMKQIEESVSTLTILVSDATWFDRDGFCLDRWDTSDSYVAITYQEKDGLCRKLFGDGCFIGTIEDGTLPGGPVLIVKENERVVASVPTRGGEVGYSFLYDAFDASKNQPETRGLNPYSWEWLNEEQTDNSNIVSAMTLKSINPDIIKAYNLFMDNSYACQNDYVFYGMTSNATEGRVRTDVRNRFFRFKLNPDAFVHVFDDSAAPSTECNFVNDYEITPKKGYAGQDSKETVYGKLWADGALEIRFTVLAGGDYDNVAPYSVKARDLFTVKDGIVKKQQWKATLIKWHITWRYSFNEDGNNVRDKTSLNAKWYYPNDGFNLPVWDLGNLSSYRISVDEIDRGVTIYTETSVTVKSASSLTTKLTYDYEYNKEKKEDDSTKKNKHAVKVELGWTKNDEESRFEKQTITWKDENDDLGTVNVSYSDKYIIRQASASTFEINTYGSNRFEFSILPYSI